MDVFLDIGFTLMGGPDLSPPKMIRRILELDEEKNPILNKIIFTENHQSPENLIFALNDALGIRVDTGGMDKIRDFWRRQHTDVYEIDGASELLDHLHDQGMIMHIASNLWFPFYQKFRTIFRTQAPFITSKTLSFQDGVKKPSPEFYKKALKRSGADPKQSIMIGDSVSKDILPFAELGASCIWFKSRPIDPVRLKTLQEKLSAHKNIYEVETLKEARQVIDKIRGGGK
ncbi:MAG: HAD family hydrolase [Desulfobacterales bacterium]|nr:HAD family hydrolase [Desulfobacterales bacterium]